MIAVGLQKMQEPIDAKSMSDNLTSTEVPEVPATSLPFPLSCTRWLQK